MFKICAISFFFLNLFLTEFCHAQALPQDTVYHFRVVSEDASPFAFAKVKTMSSGIIIASRETNMDGKVSIRKKDLGRNPHVVLTIYNSGYESISFKTDTLRNQDTIVVVLKPKPVDLDEIRIIAYKVPMIEEKRMFRRWHRQRLEKAPEPVPLYTPGQCIAYEALEQGLWLKKDTLLRNTILAWDTARNKYQEKGASLYRMIQLYLMNSISYPKQAQDFFMEEKVYVCFELDEKGAVQYIKVMKGTHVDLVLEVANALARMPRLNVRDAFQDYSDWSRPKALKPVRFVLPVKFILQ